MALINQYGQDTDMPIHMPVPGDSNYKSPEDKAAESEAKYPGGVGMPTPAARTNDSYAPPPNLGGDQVANGVPQPTYGQAPAAAPAAPDFSQDPSNPFKTHPSGGGVKLPTGEWVPLDHPLAAQAGPAAAAPGAQPAAGGVPPPTQYTSTPDMQNVQRDTILAGLARSQQPVTADSQNIKAQLDPFRAEQERTRVQAEAEAAEAASTAGMANSGALNLAKRSAQERAGQQTGLRASELVGRELQSQRDELKQFLDLNAKTIDADQARMLQKQLADLDAQIRREGIASSAALGGQELNLRRDLGQQGINNDIMRMLLQNQQFGNQLGFQIGNAEAGWNRNALLDAMGD